MTLLGHVDRAAGAVHLARHLPVPPHVVWAALTDPARLSAWLAPVESGAPGDGATFVIRMNPRETATCTVVGWDPPHELRLTWDYTDEGPRSWCSGSPRATAARSCASTTPGSPLMSSSTAPGGRCTWRTSACISPAGTSPPRAARGGLPRALGGARAPLRRDRVMTVALVTGAARGVGRGIALALAGTGATVHVVDRESSARRHSSLGGTVEDVAAEVDARGGHGVAHVVDHAEDLDGHEIAAVVASSTRSTSSWPTRSTATPCRSVPRRSGSSIPPTGRT